MPEFIIGLAIGLSMLFLHRRRYDAKLKRLLHRIESRHSLPALGYEAQLASVLAQRQSQSETLDEQLQDLRHVLKHAPVGYLQVDEENRLLWCNRRAQEFLDIAQSDYAQPRLLLAIVRSYELDQLVERTRQSQEICQARWTFNSISTDPSNYLERPAYPLKGYGLPISHGHVGVFLENKQEAVILAQQRDRWISDVAHELKTPLTSIRLVAETLQPRIDPELSSWLERLLGETIRLSKLVDDVLNMSHLEQRRTQLEDVEDVDLGGLVQAAWHSIEPLARLKQLSLRCEAPSSPVVSVNASLMHRVMFNLLSNAVKYSPAGQVILVRLSLAENPSVSPLPESSEALSSEALERVAQKAAANDAERWVLIEVIDAGVGLAEKDLPYIFDRFYRADPARSKNSLTDAASDGASEGASEGASDGARAVEIAELSSSGTGLGLAIVRQIVESYQGRVEASNNPETGGGWMRVWLPGKRLVSAFEGADYVKKS